MKTKASRSPRAALPHKLRIIGGQWRGRKLDFPPIESIRPTPDRVRETVFNWLQSDVVGKRCLDLFAGSGALGFEALSRGAAHVTFVDLEPRIARYLRDTLAHLQGSGEVHASDALRWLRSSAQPFDVVFLDPPFADNVLQDVCLRLEEGNWLAPRALIYIERAAGKGPPDIPVNWELVKSKSTGQVGYHLARRNSTPNSTPSST